jgi:5-oxoprolinase (ATP-hydrolysing) subunit A
MTIDLNSDLGEGAGYDEEILSFVTSASITCGFHAGTPGSIFDSIRAAAQHHVAIGAHPSFDDRKNFGRTEMSVTPDEVFSLVTYQLGAFRALCHAAEAEMNHVKPHGALYNMSARDRQMAHAIARAIRAFDSNLILFAPPASKLEQAGRELRLQTASEVFADRNYNSDGTLVSRTRPDALLHDPVEAAKRIIRILREKKVRDREGGDLSISADTICVHGDTPGAVTFVRTLRARLEAEGISIAAPRGQT